MRDCNHAVKKAIFTPVARDLDDVDNVLGVAPISDNNSADSSLFSHALQSAGGIWDNNSYDDDVSNAHEGENLVPPYFNGNEGVQPALNNIPAPEGAPCRNHGNSKEYPPAVWCHEAEGKLQRILLSVLCQEYKNLNHNKICPDLWSTRHTTYGSKDV
jgi:hypothetical protein